MFRSRARRALAVLLVAALSLGVTGAAAAPTAQRVEISEYKLPDATTEALRADWLEQLRAENPPGTWAPARMTLDDKHLALMGLPPADVLQSLNFDQPTMVDRDGTATPVDLPPYATFAGTGWFGIRPGAFLLIINAAGITWCSMAHVYGAPGSYDISTAGHCANAGQTATVIAAFGNANGTLNPILLNFGRFATSTGDGGLGRDWAMIDIFPEFQNLVTPTMAFWGGPRGRFTKSGATARITFNGLVPTVSTNTDPALAQAIAHYGHGTGIGAGGTPRAGAAFHWGGTHFMFSGAISPGDSGSGANTLGGDAVGDTMEAAGIITHIWIDALMRDGIGIMAGTRVSAITAPLANGQLVSYPVPAPGLP